METTEERWARWDRLIVEKNYLQVIKEFDLLFLKKAHLTIGDLVRRDEALEMIGVASFCKEKAKKQEVEKRERFRKGKH